MCHAQLKPEIQYTSVVAQAILETSGRGSFIAPAVGFLHYGPSCYLYDHVCNFNYQGVCQLTPMYFECETIVLPFLHMWITTLEGPRQQVLRPEGPNTLT